MWTCPGDAQIYVGANVEVENVAAQRWVCHKHNGVLIHLPVVSHCQARSCGVVLGKHPQLHPCVTLKGLHFFDYAGLLPQVSREMAS